jgi:hypothetical protein
MNSIVQPTTTNSFENNNKSWNEDDINYLYNNYDPNNRLTLYKACEKLKRTEAGIHKICSPHGVRGDFKRPFTPEDLSYIKRHYHTMDFVELCRKFGTSKICMWKTLIDMQMFQIRKGRRCGKHSPMRLITKETTTVYSASSNNYNNSSNPMLELALQEKESLIKQLENNPIYIQLQKIDKVIEIYS